MSCMLRVKGKLLKKSLHTSKHMFGFQGRQEGEGQGSKIPETRAG